MKKRTELAKHQNASFAGRNQNLLKGKLWQFIIVDVHKIFSPNRKFILKSFLVIHLRNFFRVYFPGNFPKNLQKIIFENSSEGLLLYNQ